MDRRVFLPAAVAVISVVSLFTLADERSNPDEKLPDFSGKTLLVYTSRVPQHPTWIMVDSRLRQIGGRIFLSGKYADTRREQDWRSGLETHIAWDVVTTYQVLAPMEYEKFLNDAHRVGAP